MTSTALPHPQIAFFYQKRQSGIPGMIYPRWTHAEYSQLPTSPSWVQKYHPRALSPCFFQWLKWDWATCSCPLTAFWIQLQDCSSWPLKGDRKCPCWGISHISQQLWTQSFRLHGLVWIKISPAIPDSSTNGHPSSLWIPGLEAWETLLVKIKVKKAVSSSGLSVFTLTKSPSLFSNHLPFSLFSLSPLI